MTTADSLVGATLDGRYFVESRIAGGGMATVYVAHDQRLGRRVALKVMHASLAADPQFVRRFINEAHSVAKLSHPNVVQVFDQGTDQGHVYLAMEYIEGRTLRDLLDGRGRLAPRDALQLLAPVLAALGAAHRAGMVHRDVKPENVLLTPDGRVKVADFGLARATEGANQGMTSTGALMGTAGYLAPEQITDSTADARSDVYAAGILLYELLTGSQPYQGDSPIAVAYQHVNDDVPAPSAKVGGVPPEVDALVVAATRHDPAERPADAGGFLARLLEVLGPMPETGPNMPLTYATAAMGHDSPGGSGGSGGNQTLVVDIDPADLQPREGPPARRTRNYPMILVGAVVAAALLAFGWWMLMGRYAEVPELVGMSEDQALGALRDSGLKMKVSDDRRYSDDADDGEIAAADPGVGASILPNEIVTVTLSKGPQNVPMPDVVGESAGDARKTLEDAGITDIKEKKEESFDQPSGTVLSTDPPAEEEADREGTVTLSVAAGFEAPKVVGMKEGDARSALEDSKLKVDVVQESSDDVAKGQVMKQDPKAGGKVDSGDTVTITVSTGPEQVKIPDIRGMKVGAAKKKLEDLGFKVKVNRVIGDRVGEFNPKGEAKKGAEVEIWTSPFGGRDGGRGGNRGNDDDD
ncbi:serine/threonine-protein kinase [Murinocardiopsis flavida]|uniref:non-specific serine/threonine protein kinase n=2 Tax=Murinocardiopsis flavida TaxID=645275 RepID=A0A2P8DI79_9ACTN|nr:serine/threonine-protein kinase [Murinocardiopsis flavida]